MNERIKEIIKQATTVEEHKWGVSYDKFDREKFAELIVRECMQVIDTELAATDIAGECEESWKMGMECSMGLIKAHFGVEE
jgi:hypothetical protein